MEKLGFMQAFSGIEDEYYECCRDLLIEWFIPFR